MCTKKPGDNSADWRIALPEDLIKPTVKWYHQVKGHSGGKRLDGQLRQRYYHRDLHQMADSLNYNFCQKNTLDGMGYGFLPECEVQSILIKEHAVNLLGPLS
jgi:hypothetical protein